MRDSPPARATVSGVDPQRIGIDTGGTFTDVALRVRGGLRIFKTPSTPADPGEAVRAGIGLAGRSEALLDVVHGTTVGLNAVLTGRLARTAFVTNAGFIDLLEIGRQDRLDLYALEPSRAEVPVPRRLRFGVKSRREVDGRQSQKPGREELRRLRRAVHKARPEAIAIGLLHSYAHPEDEQVIAKALAGLGVPITCSAALRPQAGEFERFVAAVLNAAIQPVVSRYVGGLQESLSPSELRLLRSSGGIMSGAEAHAFPARALLSGPAGGVLASRQLAKQVGAEAAAAFDMGGTSTDVCLVRQHSELGTAQVGGLPLILPSEPVHTVGCGGGSIAWADAGGALRVGPQSAGADPGPACYGQGEEPTVTDAHMALGHMGAETLLGGGFPVDPDRSVRAIEGLARRLHMRPRRCAEGILEVAEVNMMRALMVITVQQSLDPAGIPLIAYGGAGALHAARLAARLQMPAAWIPADPGAFSAVGLALAAESFEALLPIHRLAGELSSSAIDALRGDAQAMARAAMPGSRPRLRLSWLLRYAGQGGGLEVPFDVRPTRSAAAVHARRFGFVPEGREIEILSLRVRADARSSNLPRGRSGTSIARAIPHFKRRPPLDGAALPVFLRADLGLGQRLEGPCLVEETTAVTRVPEGFCARVEHQGLRLEAGDGRPRRSFKKPRLTAD